MSKQGGTMNLFAKSKANQEDKPKKSKGTVWELPRELDAEGKLTGESAILHQAVTDAIAADAAKKAAENKGNMAKSRLSQYALSRYVENIANLGVLPTTPMAIANHVGESVTYVVQDKSGQNAITLEQKDMLASVLGEEVAEEIVVERTVFSFNPEVMQQKAAGRDRKSVV